MSGAIAAVYRFFNNGVLSRLPAPAAIALGQAARRLLPWGPVLARRILQRLLPER